VDSLKIWIGLNPAWIAKAANGVSWNDVAYTRKVTANQAEGLT